MSSAKWRPFCLGLNELMRHQIQLWHPLVEIDNVKENGGRFVTFTWHMGRNYSSMPWLRQWFHSTAVLSCNYTQQIMGCDYLSVPTNKINRSSKRGPIFVPYWNTGNSSLSWLCWSQTRGNEAVAEYNYGSAIHTRFMDCLSGVLATALHLVVWLKIFLFRFIFCEIEICIRIHVWCGDFLWCN